MSNAFKIIFNPYFSSVIAALIAMSLAAIKFVFFAKTGLIVIALSAWDSFADSFISLINYKVTKFSQSEADAEHPYGHGKAESLVALAQGCMIAGGGVMAYYGCFDRFRVGYSPNSWGKNTAFYVIVLFVFNAVVSLFISKFLERNAKKVNSTALVADSKHYSSDVWSNSVSALAASVVFFLNWHFADILASLVLGTILLISGFELCKQCIDDIMDKSISEDVKLQILSELNKLDFRIIDIHKLRGRKSGNKYFFDCHMTLPVHLNVQEIHDIQKMIEKRVFDVFGGEISIHVDPQKSA